MIDYDLLVKIGWTALLGWNLKETVSNGKDIVRLKVKVENGLTHGLQRLERTITMHIHGEERRIMEALRRDPNTRTGSKDT
jgi:hypothetical protein